MTNLTEGMSSKFLNSLLVKLIKLQVSLAEGVQKNQEDREFHMAELRGLLENFVNVANKEGGRFQRNLVWYFANLHDCK